MNTQEKSLKLAELMPEVKISESGRVLFPHDYYDEQWNPYENLAQFAAIMLKFPDVFDCLIVRAVRPKFRTQRFMLDAVLLENGVDV